MVGELRRGDKVVIATHNEGKARELAELFAPIGIDTVSAGALGLFEPEETGATLRRERQDQGWGGVVRHWYAFCRRRFRTSRSRHSAALPASIRPAGVDRTRTFASPWSASIANSRRAARPTGARISSARWRLASREARRWCASARSTGQLSGRRVACAVSATIRSSCLTAIAETFGEMDPVEKSAISHRMRAFEKLILSTWPYDED